MEIIKRIPIEGLTKRTEFLVMSNNEGYLIQDVSEQQNIETFIKGLLLIKDMKGKRGEFLRDLMSRATKDFTLTMSDLSHFSLEKYCKLIAFVCDIANHNKLKNWKGVYDKDYPKFVANLCWNYYLDEDFNSFKNNETPKYTFYKTILKYVNN